MRFLCGMEVTIDSQVNPNVSGREPNSASLGEVCWLRFLFEA